MPLSRALVVFALALTACPKSAPDKAPVVVSEETKKAEEAAKAAPDPRVLDDDRRCTTDAECTLTTTDCCGCNALGTQTGVRKDHLDALAQRRAPVCGAVACGQAVSDDPSCTAQRAVCRGGVCVPDVPGAGKPASKPPVEPIH